MTTEEARPTRFRLLLASPDRLPGDGQPNRGVLRLPFDHRRALHADELRRVGPAVPFETALIGAHVEDGELRVWGLAHSGPAWLALAWGGRSVVPIWTYDPIVHVTGASTKACVGWSDFAASPSSELRAAGLPSAIAPIRPARAPPQGNLDFGP